jgi:CO/xanthine dehydrogenase FAD-binding subunit
MKAVPFDYIRPETVDEACSLLAQDENAKIIAGGQTLMPILAMRLTRPSRLVDIERLSPLNFIREEKDAIHIGATTPQMAVEHSDLIQRRLPLLARAIRWVGHPPIRARGTVGGSIANADPAAEIGLIAMTLGATLQYQEQDSTEEVSVDDFFIGPMITALPQSACLTSIHFPVWDARNTGTGFEEVNARQSDFAFVAAAAQVSLDSDGKCERIALGIGGATDTPVRLDRACEQLKGTRLIEAKIRGAVSDALAEIEPASDLHASAAYRGRAALTLACRAIEAACKDAQQKSAHAG